MTKKDFAELKPGDVVKRVGVRARLRVVVDVSSQWCALECVTGVGKNASRGVALYSAWELKALFKKVEPEEVAAAEEGAAVTDEEAKKELDEAQGEDVELRDGKEPTATEVVKDACKTCGGTGPRRAGRKQCRECEAKSRKAAKPAPVEEPTASQSG